jgi:hypothetical protein
MAGDRVRRRWGAALVGNVIDLDGGELHQELDAEVAGAALAEGGDGDRAGLFARERHELGHVRRAQRWMRHHDHGRRRDLRDRLEVGHRIEAELLDRVRQHRLVGHALHHQRVAVGGGVRHEVGADRAARTAAVVDDERLAERSCEPLAEHTPEDVGRPAGRPRDDEPDRLRRVWLGEAWGRDEGRDETQPETGERSSQHVHPPSSSLGHCALWR